MKESQYGIIAFLAFIIGLTATALSQESDSTEIIAIDGTIHSPSEIYKILENSAVTYKIGFNADSTELVAAPPEGYSDAYYLFTDSNGKTVLREQTTLESADSVITQGEEWFKQRKFDKAIESYKLAMETDSNYYLLYTWIADAYAQLNIQDSAFYYYFRAIEKNFIDYDAHWFLGDLYWTAGDTAQAIRQLSIAHILNRDHKVIKEKLKDYRRLSGNPWKEWEFRPSCQISKDSSGVLINYSGNWLPYAITKALWLYEPGYAKRMTGYEVDSILLNPYCEQEAIAVWVSTEINTAETDSVELGPLPKRVKTIIEDGNLMPMIYYELLAYDYPKAVLLMPRDVIDGMVEYVNKYH